MICHAVFFRFFGLIVASCRKLDEVMDYLVNEADWSELRTKLNNILDGLPIDGMLFSFDFGFS